MMIPGMRIAVGLTTMLATAVLVTSAVAAAPADAGAAPEGVSCGLKRYRGHDLRILVLGVPIPCATVRKAVNRRACDLDRGWICAPLSGDQPVFEWVRAKDLVDDDFRSWVVAERYPCAEAHVDRAVWRRAARARDDGRFPTTTQLLADDITRCDLLRGMTRARVHRLLGRPSFAETWYIGRERDTIFSLDGEHLALTYGPRGRVVSAEITR